MLEGIPNLNLAEADREGAIPPPEYSFLVFINVDSCTLFSGNVTGGFRKPPGMGGMVDRETTTYKADSGEPVQHRSSAQCSVVTLMGRKSKRRGDICTYGSFTLVVQQKLT